MIPLQKSNKDRFFLMREKKKRFRRQIGKEYNKIAMARNEG